MRPSGKTASIPKHKSRVFPYLTTFTPPAFVAKFPPILADPSEAKESGNIRSDEFARSCISFRITPASAIIMFSDNQTSLTLFIRSKDNITGFGPSGIICPPTRPVPPP